MVELQWLLDRGEGTIADRQQMAGRIDALEQDGEFIPADARDEIALPHHVSEPHGDLLQQVIAGDMSEAVVDVLEMVDVDQQQADLVTGFHCPRYRGPQT